MAKARKSILTVAALTCGLLIVLASTAATQTPKAEAPRPSRVAVCDVVEVFNNYERVKDETAKRDIRVREIQQENNKRQDAIQKIAEELKLLNEASKRYEKLLEDMESLVVEREIWRQVEEGKAKRKHFKLTREMYKEILDAVEAVAKDRGYDLVLYAERSDLLGKNTVELRQEIALRKVLYCNPANDITAMTLDRLNRRFRPAGP